MPTEPTIVMDESDGIYPERVAWRGIKGTSPEIDGRIISRIAECEEAGREIASWPSDSVGHDGEPTTVYRSRWFWARTTSGDLMLACYPREDGYFWHEEEREV